MTTTGKIMNANADTAKVMNGNGIVWEKLVTWEKWRFEEHRQWDHKTHSNNIYYTLEQLLELVSAPEGTYPDNGIKDGFWYKKKG